MKITDLQRLRTIRNSTCESCGIISVTLPRWHFAWSVLPDTTLRASICKHTNLHTQDARTWHLNVAKTNTTLLLENYPWHKRKFEKCIKLNSQNGFLVSALLILGFNWGITVLKNSQKRDISFVHADEWHATKKQDFSAKQPLELWNFANITAFESLNQFFAPLSVTEYTIRLWCEIYVWFVSDKCDRVFRSKTSMSMRVLTILTLALMGLRCFRK